jgi:hypothetical protein
VAKLNSGGKESEKQMEEIQSEAVVGPFVPPAKRYEFSRRMGSIQCLQKESG